MNVLEGVGIIEEKSEAMSKKGKYWRYKIRMDNDLDAKYPTSFSMWEYEAGKEVSVDDHIKVTWEENPGKNAVGKDVTYRNIKSISKTDTVVVESVRDPKLGTDSQLASQAPKEAMKEVLHKEKGEGGGSPITSYKEAEERKESQ